MGGSSWANFHGRPSGFRSRSIPRLRPKTCAWTPWGLLRTCTQISLRECVCYLSGTWVVLKALARPCEHHWSNQWAWTFLACKGPMWTKWFGVIHHLPCWDLFQKEWMFSIAQAMSCRRALYSQTSLLRASSASGSGSLWSLSAPLGISLQV